MPRKELDFGHVPSMNIDESSHGLQKVILLTEEQLISMSVLPYLCCNKLYLLTSLYLCTGSSLCFRCH